MYLVYMDDGGKDAVKVFGGIVLEDIRFKRLEANVGFLATRHLSREKQLAFTEFHASDLLNGKPPFDEYTEERRRQLFTRLVQLPGEIGFPYFYSAIDMRALRRSALQSANWQAVAFKMCARAVDDFLHAKQEQQAHISPPVPQPVNMLIVDDPESKATQGQLRDAFREMRRPFRFDAGWKGNVLLHSVDDLFFGASKDSAGLQVADACNYVMYRFFRDGIKDEFYDALMTGHVQCARPEPDWTNFRTIFRAHDSESS